jgi:hypothetical protein
MKLSEQQDIEKECQILVKNMKNGVVVTASDDHFPTICAMLELDTNISGWVCERAKDGITIRILE